MAALEEPPSTMDDDLRSPPGTATTRNFRQSVHLIPTIREDDRPKSYEPIQLHLWVILPASLLMVGLGVAVEVALSFSNKHSGFHVKRENIFKFVSQQFLTSFIPIVLVAPLALLWESKLWLVKRYQPYINLSRGSATVDNSLLLDYISLSALYSIFESFQKRHWLVLISSLCGLASLLLQPLAGSIFSIVQVPEPSSGSVTSIRSLGLDPTFSDLTSFLSAAGYVQAAVEDNLPDPPFINQNWAAADFVFPTDNYLNGTVTVDTTGIRTNATCSAPVAINSTEIQSSSIVIDAISQSNCGLQVTLNLSDSAQQYGVVGVPQCGPNQNLNPEFWPVFFYFFHTSASTIPGNQSVAGVFCNPTLEVLRISANASLNNGSLTHVSIIGSIDSNNNVTGAPLNGIPFNGVFFNPDVTQVGDVFTQARAIATNNEVPGAILRAVTLNNTFAQTAFSNIDGFVDVTSRIYTQHLALVAKNTYFLTTNQTIPAVISALSPRLQLVPIPSHFLAALLIILGSTMFIVAVVHHRIRKGVFLAAPPGSIASAIALTSHSGFGIYLVPYDTEVNITTKLDGLLFSFDKRTGAVICEDNPKLRAALASAGMEPTDVEGVRKKTGSVSSQEETEMALLGSPGVGTPLEKSGYLVEPFTPPAASLSPQDV